MLDTNALSAWGDADTFAANRSAWQPLALFGDDHFLASLRQLNEPEQVGSSLFQLRRHVVIQTRAGMESIPPMQRLHLALTISVGLVNYVPDETGTTIELSAGRADLG